jgi:hypothetical protein
MSRAVYLPLLAMLVLSGCSAGSMSSGGSGQADMATHVACAERVNQIYDARDREDIYAANPSMNSPFSANYQAGVSSRGLANEFEYRRMQTDCEHDSGPAAAEQSDTPVTTVAPAPKGR